MGGGDLNQKKSWHPQTMKNQERVWKAEQAKNQEEKRVNELRKEINEERNREELRRMGESSGVLAKTDADKKLEWMYKSSTELINREEYLLGRTIDKSFEILQEEEKNKEANLLGIKQPLNHVEHECIPFSIREYRNLESTEQVDLQRKVMEDPLMLIKQREMESRRKILENPVKLKELHRILKNDRQLDSSKKSNKFKKSKKTKKKHKKRRKSTDSSETTIDSDEDLDTKLAKKYKKVKNTILDEGKDSKNLSLTNLLEAKYETISKELDKAVDAKRNKHKKKGRSLSSSGSEQTYEKSRSSKHRQHERKRTMHRSNSRARSSGRIRSRTPEGRQLYKHYQESDRERDRRQNKPRESSGKQQNVKTNKLTEEEKEARRREMMENAAWRDADRTRAVKKHREAYAHEENQNKTREFDKNFINKEVKKAIANQSSVGSRIRSNLNNIQRTTSSMNSNFARK